MAFQTPEPSWQREHVKQTKLVNDPLAVIYDEGQWRLNRVSPLYNLLYDTVKLKQYATKVRHALVSSIAANSSIKYTVQFEAQPHLKYNEDDDNGLMINVAINQGNNTKTKLVYCALLLSWGVSANLIGATHLPYMLERGEQKYGTVVKATLQTVFDCTIKQLCFTQPQLLELGLNFSENIMSREIERFTLVYRTPQVDFKDKLTVSIDIEDVKIIWNAIQDEVTNNSDLVNLAYKILQNQIYYMLELDVSVLELCEVVLSKAEVKSNGVVKMKTPEIVNSVFTLMNEISDVQSMKDLSD